MELFKNYKKLYQNELANRKLLIEQNSKLSKQRIDSDIRSHKLAEENAKLRIELEDLGGFYIQEKEAKEELLKQRKVLRRKITMLEKELKKDEEN